MNDANSNSSVEKIETGIAGLDVITHGGLPRGRTTLVSGTAGCGKTVVACQFLAEGIRKSGETGVFVTFEESPQDIRRNMLGFGWPIEQWEAERKWYFVDASPQEGEPAVVAGDFDFGALLSRIEHAAQKIKAQRVAPDSLGAVFTRFADSSRVRGELFRAATTLKRLGVTSVLTAERAQEHGALARYGVEEFVADNVILISNSLEEEKRRRTLEILKFRGTSHQKGAFPFSIMPNEGLIVIPLSAIELKQQSSHLRITSGVEELDRMCGGGFYRDSIVLVSGATGTGKTLMGTHFVAGGAAQGERSLIFAFEESERQLFRNAAGWGIDLEKMADEGLLKVVCVYPEMAGVEDHLINLKAVVDEFKPNRVTVDSLSAIERVCTLKSFREFVIGLTSFIKDREVAGLFTSTTASIMGGSSITEAHISTITDSIILLRYVEMYGEMQRGITVLKMRGSMHDKDIRGVMIDDNGMHIGKPFRNITGILSGNPVYLESSQVERIADMFREEETQG